MTDEQFKQLMDKLEEIKKALPVVPAMPTYQVAPSLPQPPYVPGDGPYPGPFAPYASPIWSTDTPPADWTARDTTGRAPAWQQGGNIVVSK
jgi:hypothetical protein